jgi:hypothetical protein
LRQINLSANPSGHWAAIREPFWILRKKCNGMPNGVKLTVLAGEAQPFTKLKALGFMGINVQGGHHQPHHLMMAMGQFDMQRPR